MKNPVDAETYKGDVIKSLDEKLNQKNYSINNEDISKIIGT